VPLRDSIQRDGHHELLSRRKSQSSTDSNFSETVQTFFEFR
jgi:hypothetical protein